jgi:hypothetical protein
MSIVWCSLVACVRMEQFLNLKFISKEEFSSLKHARWKTIPVPLDVSCVISTWIVIKNLLFASQDWCWFGVLARMFVDAENCICSPCCRILENGIITPGWITTASGRVTIEWLEVELLCISLVASHSWLKRFMEDDWVVQMSWNNRVRIPNLRKFR